MLSAVAVALMAQGSQSYAADAIAAPHQQISSRSTLIFSAPPRESEQAGKNKYEPIAEYLSKVLGKPVIYRHPGTWGVYRTEMLRGKYDILFDGPHFNAYRAQKLRHNILAKAPIQHQFVVITQKNNNKIKKVGNLTGRTVCAHAPPNLGTLTLLNNFSNPMRQPIIMNTKGWKNIYEGVASGKCNGGILPIANLNKFDAARTNVRIIYKDRTLPNQAFSVGPRLSSQDQLRVAKALTSDSAEQPTRNLRAAYRVGERFVPANNKEYKGVEVYLKHEWGYYD
ncbi:MAG: PhnD/SsuA/transferrin family substrate-binding protein [Proteobacteria bacterium]|nr:PhnD/SsuA/transferrin family substrate-binding protein [Pseudomonadota bacterium]